MFKIIIYIIVGLGLIFSYVKYIELKGIFFPSREVELNPHSINLPFEDIYVKTQNNLQISAWFIPCDGAKYTLLLLHGNAGNLQDRLGKLNLLHQLGLNIFIIDYRGYGRSKGSPSESGLYFDSQAAYNYLINTRKVSAEEIILYGESLGTAVAIDLASRFPVKALILEGAFSSGKDMARIIYPFIPVFFFSDRFDSLKKIRKVRAPKLFLHSGNDEIVPFSMAKKLFAAADEPKFFVEINGDHNNAFLDSKEKCLSSILSFLHRLST